MEGSQKQVAWAQAIKADMMPGINTIKNSFVKRAAGNAQLLATIEKIMAALEAKNAAWWIDHRPEQNDKLSAGAFEAAWKEVAAEVIKG